MKRLGMAAFMTKILLFGTFDGIHDGHRRLFAEVRALADYLIVAITPDVLVPGLKGHLPRRTQEQRILDVRREGVDEVVLGDVELGAYEVIGRVKPDLIGVGYDQDALCEHVTDWVRTHCPKLRIVRLAAWHPETFKSSFL